MLMMGWPFFGNKEILVNTMFFLSQSSKIIMGHMQIPVFGSLGTCALCLSMNGKIVIVWPFTSRKKPERK